MLSPTSNDVWITSEQIRVTWSMEETRTAEQVPDGISIDIFDMETLNTVGIVRDVPYFPTDNNEYSFVTKLSSAMPGGSHYVVRVYFKNLAGVIQGNVSEQFSIRKSLVAASESNFELLYPHLAAAVSQDTKIFITWQSSSLFVQSDKISITLWQDNQHIKTLAENIPNIGLYRWDVGQTELGTYYLKIENINDGVFRSSNGPSFSVVEKKDIVKVIVDVGDAVEFEDAENEQDNDGLSTITMTPTSVETNLTSEIQSTVIETQSTTESTTTVTQNDSLGSGVEERKPDIQAIEMDAPQTQ